MYKIKLPPRLLHEILYWNVPHVWLSLRSSEQQLMFVYLPPVKHPQEQIFNKSHTVLHLVIACVTDTDSPKRERGWLWQSAVITVACNKHLAATSADLPGSGSVSSSTDSSRPLCRHWASFCTQKQTIVSSCKVSYLQTKRHISVYALL